jgi:protein-tyrosine-phosphatase
MSLILLVCTGNLCRSPMAAGLLRQRLEERGLDTRHRVRSAGVWALDGEPASAHALAVMSARGIDISEHIAHTITSEDASEADLILVMSREHEQMIRHTWPQYSWKIHRLSEMAGKRQDIQDPYRGPIEEYQACADTISSYVDRGLERILELAG